MTLSAHLEAAPLSVVLDVRYPLAALALSPTLELAGSLGLDVNWLPLSVPALNPPSEPGPGDDRGIRHRRFRAQAIAREIETYSAAQGLVMREWYRDGDAGAAHMGWLWVRDRHRDALPGFLRSLFGAYWSLDLDASSVEWVARLVDSADADGASFAAWCASDGPVALDALEDELRAFGLHQVPAYVVGDEVFIGRQHLPMIRWTLEGRTGALPI